MLEFRSNVCPLMDHSWDPYRTHADLKVGQGERAKKGGLEMTTKNDCRGAPAPICFYHTYLIIWLTDSWNHSNKRNLPGNFNSLNSLEWVLVHYCFNLTNATPVNQNSQYMPSTTSISKKTNSFLRNYPTKYYINHLSSKLLCSVKTHLQFDVKQSEAFITI